MLLIYGIFFFTVAPLGVSCTCTGTQLTDADREAVLNAHNSRRSNIAKGLEPTLGGGNAPSASQMYKMTYDCDIEAHAQAYCDLCQLNVHSNAAGYGENLYWNTASLTAGGHLEKASEMWWSELIQNGISDPTNTLTSAVFSAGVGHFTQMAWWKTTKIGCGVKLCESSKYQVVCQYQAPGNYLNQVIYPLGSPCTSDAACTFIAGSTCSVSEGLCVDPTATTLSTTTASTTTASTTTASTTTASGPTTTPSSNTSSGSTASTTAGGTTATGGYTAPCASVCQDVAPNCAVNAVLCLNSLYRDVMMRQCPKTCNLCCTAGTTTAATTCVDRETNCATNQALCSNNYYKDLMRTACPMTCGVCSPGETFPACRDLADNCERNVNLCTNALYLQLMTQQCAQTCQKC